MQWNEQKRLLQKKKKKGKEISSMRTISSGDENPERKLSRSTPVCHINDDTRLYTQEMHLGYKFTKSQEKISCQMYMDNIKMFARNEKCAMLLMKSKKREAMKGINLSNKESMRTLRKKKKYNYLRT